jgi:Kdo-III transferase WaaZ
MLSIEPLAQLQSAASEAPFGSQYEWPTRSQRLSATFFKLLYRWTHSRAFRHNERLSHGVSIKRDACGFLERMVIAGHELPMENRQGLFASRKGACHLIATGPSVNEIDYNALELQQVMGVNGAIALQDKQRIRFDYYCIVDAGFVRKRPDLVARVVQERLTLFATPLVLWYLAQYFPMEQLRCRVVLIEDIQYPACKRALCTQELISAHRGPELVLFDEDRTLGFSLNVRRGIFDGRTVAYTGLQICHSLGFDTVFMHGLDLRNAARTPRFYETSENMQPSALDEDLETFIRPAFRHAAALLKSRGVRVLNLSPHSALGADILETCDWRTLLPVRQGHTAHAATHAAITQA